MTRASDTARLVSGGAVFNEASNDVDFRVESDDNANMFIVDSGQNKVGIGVSPAKGMLHIQPSARTTNFDASDHTTYADIYVHNPTDDDTCATGIAFATDASSFDNGASGIACLSGTGDSESSLAFITRPNGAVAAEAMRIDSSGRLLVGTTQTLFDNAQTLQVSGSQACNMRSTVASADGGHVIGLIRSGNTQGDYIRFFDSSANETGQIRVDSGGVCRYEDVSDYRLKDNIKDWDVDASAKVKQVKIRTFDWKDQTAVTNGKGLIGVIAHELQEVYPHCVSGEKDGYGGDVDKDGNKKPMYQGVDYGKLTPLLTKALQEALARIDTLEAEVTKLKG